MDYTLSNSYDTHAGTGNRMHEDAKAVPTVVSGSDMNSIIWSLMEILKAAGLPGLQFDKTSPASYQQLLKAIGGVTPGRLSAIRILTGAGTFTKSAGCKHYEVMIIGGAGGGGIAPATGSGVVGMASGGNGGAHCASLFLNATAASFAYSCGAGGAPGGNGGATTFSYPGGVMTAPGGGAGGSGGPGSIPVAIPSAPNSSIATGGNIYNAPSQPGGYGLILTGGAAVSGSGGNSPMGNGGTGSSGAGGGLAGQGYGAGGAGGLTGSGSGAQAGGVGTPGVIRVKEYF